MKSKWTYLFLVFLMLMSISKGQSQDAGVRPERVKPMAELEYSMEQQMLTDAQLTSFQVRAIQKLKDVEGYLELMYDESLDEGFRERAEELAKQAFWLPEYFTSFVQLTQKRGKLSKVETLGLGEQRRSDPVGLHYTGMLSLTFAEGDEIILPIFLYRVIKPFGKDRQSVWEINFGG